MLLIHQLNTGNLSRRASSTGRARSCARGAGRLTLERCRGRMEGFFVDLAGTTGLCGATGQDRGSMLRYLDTTPLAEQLERAIDRAAQTRR